MHHCSQRVVKGLQVKEIQPEKKMRRKIRCMLSVCLFVCLFVYLIGLRVREME